MRLLLVLVGMVVVTSAVSIEDIMGHLNAFQKIADENNGNRAAQFSGYNASLAYVRSVLESETNYTITQQPFNFDITTEGAPPKLAQISPNSAVYQRGLEYLIFSYSGSGRAEAPVSFAQDGCAANLFVGFPAGNIALVIRGNCDFAQKTKNAVAAGASAVVIFNYEGQGAFTGTLGSIQEVPVLGVSHDLGVSFMELEATLSVFVDMIVTTVYTSNLIADTTVGRTDQVIVVGSHLDGVPAGPGINDNGSGSATNLELATELYKSIITLANQVRFAWWGAEELGLLGSEYYVSQAIQSGEINNIALNLNFDMLASPNYFRGVYDGAGAAAGIRTGSVNIEHLFTSFFSFEGLPWNLTAFDGRSDYGPFIANGIPAGGLASGAEVIKPDYWRRFYGGLANAAFDPCYHQKCDDIYNINQDILGQVSHSSSLLFSAFPDHKVERTSCVLCVNLSG